MLIKKIYSGLGENIHRLPKVANKISNIAAFCNKVYFYVQALMFKKLYKKLEHFWLLLCICIAYSYMS